MSLNLKDYAWYEDNSDRMAAPGWPEESLTGWAYMICVEMYGSGYLIIMMGNIMKVALRDNPKGPLNWILIVFSVVVPG